MTVANLLKDIFTGNFTSAEARIKDWWDGVEPSLKAFFLKAESDEGKIIDGLIQTAAQDVMANGLTTASFVSAALDVEAKAAAQELNFLRTEIFALLNIAVANLQTQSGTATTATGAIATPVADPTAA